MYVNGPLSLYRSGPTFKYYGILNVSLLFRSYLNLKRNRCLRRYTVSAPWILER
jgi:hypothetical protein